MATVTQRIRQVSQPRGGFINPKSLEMQQLDDDHPSPLDQKRESIHASLVGLSVDYLTRLMTGSQPQDAFRISIKGAAIIGEREQAACLLDKVNGLDHTSITNACKLVGYDVIYRSGIAGYRPVETIHTDAETAEHIALMVRRSISFLKEFGPVTLEGFTFPGAFTEVVTDGDGDFLTSDTLWDFKVSVRNPTKDHTLQLLMYWLMGVKSGQPQFRSIRYLGIFNPRLNKVYRREVSSVPADVIEQVSRDIIGY